MISPQVFHCIPFYIAYNIAIYMKLNEINQIKRN